MLIGEAQVVVRAKVEAANGLASHTAAVMRSRSE
jgi:hypothetical protein